MHVNLDSASHLAAVDRAVAATERAGQPAHAITLSRAFATTAEDLWDAITRPERIARWFLPVSGNLEEGGRYQIEGNAGGAVTACVPRVALALTWEFGGDMSWVDVRLSGDDEGSVRLTLTHTSHLSEQWDEYGPGATGVGWELGLMGLAFHIEQPARPQPDEQALATSAEGRAFIAGSSAAWARAAIAAGDEPEAAGAASRRTAAFYTGEVDEPV